jgi:hypothetical protein
MHPDNFTGNNSLLQPGPSLVPGRTDQTGDHIGWSLVNAVVHVFVFFVSLPWMIGAYKEIKEQDKRYEEISKLLNESKKSR